VRGKNNSKIYSKLNIARLLKFLDIIKLHLNTATSRQRRPLHRGGLEWSPIYWSEPHRGNAPVTYNLILSKLILSLPFMKKINLLYIGLLGVGLMIFYINRSYVQQSTTFYGFAENKETEINLDHSVFIEKVHIKDGQFVSKGDLLLDVQFSNIDFKLNDVTNDLEQLDLKSQEKRKEILNKIKRLEAEKTAKIEETKTKIETIKAEVEFSKSLIKDLKSIEVDNNSNSSSPLNIEIETLQSNLNTDLKPLNLELQQLSIELREVSNSNKIQKKKLEYEKEYFQKEEKKLQILAPSDGLIGNLRCKEGEHISSFNTLISFYQQNPTIVKGFVHENLILHVQVGDTLEVTSSLHPAHTVMGTVSGLGFRIVEIPERLRKRPEIKTYGREVLIQIPPDNPFLQKEKVVLNLLNLDDLPAKPLFPFLNDQHSSNLPINQAINLNR
jgi:multidrug resistance efflux pump